MSPIPSRIPRSDQDRPRRSPIWMIVWIIVGVGLIGNLAIVAYLFLGALWT